MPEGDIGAVDEYLADLSDEDRRALEELRATIVRLAPEATQRISYGGIAVLAHDGDLVGFGARPKHLSLYTMSPGLVKGMKEELRPYQVSGATIHFTAQDPIPEALIEAIVRARLGDNADRKR